MRLRAVVAALVLLALAGVAGATKERRLILPLGGDAAPAHAEAFLPAVWIMGDAVAVLAGTPRPRVRNALLEAGAAVVEFGRADADGLPGTAAGVAPLARALEAVRGNLGSRVVVVLGGGEAWGEAAMNARHLGYAAAVALDAPAVRAGPRPPEHERWAIRAPRFCEALARADAALGEACEVGLLRTGATRTAAR